MNRNALKTYAPQARKDFIQAMKDRAAYFGLTPLQTEPVVEKGDVAVIAGREHPRAVAGKRLLLEERIQQSGFAQTIEAIAYSWFNRFVALRFMELHGYLDHGFRVLSPGGSKQYADGSKQYADGSKQLAAGSRQTSETANRQLPTAYCKLPAANSPPEVLLHAEHIDLPNLDKNTVIDLKLAGNKENELYRMILLAQCNALHETMPFLFERVDDETELLLPENLLNSDSLIRKLVNGIGEEDWEKVEIIGWLYQYYISDKKDEVIGSVVASEDIPAATQLFTPNWIVKYLVQNTLGRQWLATYPESAIRAQMEYYIEPADQEPEVVRQLKEITPESLNPEEITLLDPACGSGHILVEAYDLFKAIYQERGYRSKDIPALILQKNLFGFEIDDRAAQLAMFALTMKARADDRRFFDSGAKPNIVTFQQAEGGRQQAEEIAYALDAAPGSDLHSAVCELYAVFEHAKTFGSLIQIPEGLNLKLKAIEERMSKVEGSGDLSWMGLKRLQPLVLQARMLSRKFDAVVANPPYMGNKYLSPLLKGFLKKHYLGFEKDLFSAFIVQDIGITKENGNLGFMSPFVWMFISSYEDLRTHLIEQVNIKSLVQLEYSGFDGATVPICTFTLANNRIAQAKGSFIKLSNFKGSEQQAPKTLEAIRNKSCGWFYEAKPDDFKKIPGSPIAYWVSENIRNIFNKFPKLDSRAIPKQGLATGDNNKFLRSWYEVTFDGITFNLKNFTESVNPDITWVPYSKGGGERKWYGFNEQIVYWKNGGEEIRNFKDKSGNERSRFRGFDFYFHEAGTWGLITSGNFSCRYRNSGFVFDIGGMSIFSKEQNLKYFIGFLNSTIAFKMLRIINPTLNFQSGDISKLPLSIESENEVIEIVLNCIKISKSDWDSFETSWDFKTLPVLQHQAHTLAKSQEAADSECLNRFAQMKQLEEENNRLFIHAYGLQDELTPDVPDDQITLHRPNREQDIKRLISYAIGCMMGRYSLEKPGLIYAHGPDGSRQWAECSKDLPYKTFLPDEDGIVPLFNSDWGIKDDATHRFVEFVNVCWPGSDGSGQQADGSKTAGCQLPTANRKLPTANCKLPTANSLLEENLKFIADSLGAASSEQPRDAIRKYFSTDFYKNHLQMYKRRPIYWLFSSGKQKAFQCLVYLHRYNESTLARLRTEYVIPIQSRIAGRIEQLEGDMSKATSTSHRNKLQKEQNDLKKQQEELRTFDEKLKHAADRKIKLDLDDGVKVNYAKFGDLLAEVKAVCGAKDED